MSNNYQGPPAPPITIGSFGNVPAVDSLVRSDWAQDITPAVVHTFNNDTDRAQRWAYPPEGSLSKLKVPAGLVEVYRDGRWRTLVDDPAVGYGQAGSGKALGFLGFMRAPMRTPNGDADIEMIDYGPDYTGPIEGTFTCRRPVVTPPCPIEVGAPTGVIPHLYRGLIFGATTATTPDTTEIRVTKNGVDVPSAAATPDGAGFFACDLGSADLALPEGPWQLQVWRSGAPEGNPWPQVPEFEDCFVQLHVITDVDYFIREIPADTSGRFSFDPTDFGEKRVAVVYRDPIGGVEDLLLAEVTSPALLRSYITAGFPGDATMFETTSYVYDQAVALVATLAIGDIESADALHVGLLKHRDSAGRFRFVRQHEGTTLGDLFMRTGAHAWAVYAWLKYLKVHPERLQYEADMVIESIDYMMGLLSATGPTSGLVLGGSGIYIPDGMGGQTFDPGYIVPWASAEHNIDIYWVLKCAATVLDDPSYLTAANTLSDAMFAKLWTGTRIRQGVQPEGYDDAYALDCQTWGSTWLHDIGKTVEAQRNFDLSELYKFTINDVTGYAISFDSPGYPGMLPNVWAEGTFGWVCAARVLDQRYVDILNGMLGVQRADGSWPYVEVEDAPNELYPYPCSISSAWAVLAVAGSGVWDD